MSNTDMIIKSLNDFNKIVDSKYKNGLFALVKEEAIFKEVVFYKKFVWSLSYKSNASDNSEIIKEFTFMVPLNKLNKGEIETSMTENLLTYIYGFILSNYTK
jgi:hypothetical protein